MIRVNLLPQHLLPVKHSLMPFLLAGLVAAIALAAMSTLFVTTQAQIIANNATLRQHQADLAELADVIEESERLESLKAQLASRISTIEEITNDRIIWSRQLWNLSRLAPPNFWYSDISVENKTVRERQQVINKTTKELEWKTVPVVKQILRVEGYVTEGEDGTTDVNPLVRSTESDEEFAAMFQLEPISFQDTTFEETPVKSFKFEYLILSKGTQS